MIFLDEVGELVSDPQVALLRGAARTGFERLARVVVSHVDALERRPHRGTKRQPHRGTRKM
jgi:DNA-binding NtrC family response regulator